MEPVVLSVNITNIEQLQGFRGVIEETHYWELMNKM